MKTKFSTVDYHSKVRVVFKNGFSHEVWVKGIIFDDNGQIGWEHIHDHNEFLEFLPDEILCILRVKYKKVRQWHILRGLIGLFSSTSTSVKTASSTASSGITGLFSSIGFAIKKVVSGIFNVIRRIVLGILNGIKRIVLGILIGIKTIVLGILNGIKRIVLGILNGIKAILSAIWANIKKLYIIVQKIRQLITKTRRRLFGIK
jgi:hypothetical protein